MPSNLDALSDDADDESEENAAQKVEQAEEEEEEDEEGGGRAQTLTAGKRALTAFVACCCLLLENTEENMSVKQLNGLRDDDAANVDVVVDDEGLLPSLLSWLPLTQSGECLYSNSASLISQRN